MDEKIPGIILSGTLAILLILSAALLSGSGLSVNLFLSPNPDPIIRSITSISFIGFLLTTSISLGIILALGKKYLFKYALIFIYSSSILGIIIGAIISPQTLQFIIPTIFGLIGIPVGIKYLNDREKELKYLKELRSGVSGAGRIIVFILIGFFISIAINSNPQELEKNFVKNIMDSTFGNTITLEEQITNQLATQMAQQEQATINQINVTLKNSNNPSLSNVISQLDQQKQEAGSKENINKIAQQLRDNKINLGSEIIKQFPMINAFAPYAWLIYSLFATLLALFISNLIIKNLSALIYTLIIQVYPRNPNPGPTQKTEEKKKN